MDTKTELNNKLSNIISNYKNSIDNLYKDSEYKNKKLYDEFKKKCNIKNFRISELVTHPTFEYQENKYLQKIKNQLRVINGRNNDYQEAKDIVPLIDKLIDYISNESLTYRHKKQLSKEKYKLHTDSTYILVLIQNLFNEASSDIKYINQEFDLNLSTPSVSDLINEPHSEYSRFQDMRIDYLKYKRDQKGKLLVRDKTRFEDMDTNKVMTNINLEDDTVSSNLDDCYDFMDEIIINPKGIFIPEIKYYDAKSIILYPNGHLLAKCAGGHVKDCGNVVRQLSIHENFVRRLLTQNNFNSHVCVCSFIVCANNKVKSTSLCPNVNIYYASTFYHSMISRLKPNINILNNEDISNIYKYIKDNSAQDGRFKYIFVFSKRFVLKLLALLYYFMAILKLDKCAYDSIRNSHKKFWENIPFK